MTELIFTGQCVDAKWLDTPLRIFAGMCSWRIPGEADQKISAKLRSGIVAQGNLVEPIS